MASRMHLNLLRPPLETDARVIESRRNNCRLPVHAVDSFMLAHLLTQLFDRRSGQIMASSLMPPVTTLQLNLLAAALVLSRCPARGPLKETRSCQFLAFSSWTENLQRTLHNPGQ